ncbi:hypothetical protein [Epilithonimonas mollis]|uniref:Uncharacterized protein n=1 Tax=Epilithonimonas mollis TaxID=216903 RepID=A0A1M6U1V4_9FLAO|nr:hypothetical protein [Epilithonimonas mollis]SHK63225.1 hypothetical protein SAMN05444371_3074 [Epilithonimonas mollis]
MYREKVQTVDVNNMEALIKFVNSHPLSTTFAMVSPMAIPPQYHLVFAQLLLQVGIFGIEWLYKKLRVKARKADYEQSFDEYLNDKDPTEKR